jgi:hypothetical protein
LGFIKKTVLARTAPAKFSYCRLKIEILQDQSINKNPSPKPIPAYGGSIKGRIHSFSVQIFGIIWEN